MRKLLVFALLIIVAQPVFAHGLKERSLKAEEGGYSIELITEPKYPVIWKQTALVVTIKKDGLPVEGLQVAFTLHYPSHSDAVSIEAVHQGKGRYSAEHTFKEQGSYEIHVGFDEIQSAFKLKVDSLGVKGVLRGLMVLLIIGALIAKSLKSCRGDRNAED